MPRVGRAVAVVALSAASSCASAGRVGGARLPDLPDPHGVAGAFAGVVGSTLLVGGGANFPDGVMPWDGGRKVWHDRVYALDLRAPSRGWRDAGRLPAPNGYGVSVTTADEVLVIGGGDAERHFSEVWAMRLDGGRVAFRALPSLPRPLAQLTGALVGRTVHVVGGIEHPRAAGASSAHWALDLDDVTAGWRVLPPLPAAGRMLATAAAVGDALIVLGGCSLAPDGDGGARRTYLREAWRYAGGAWTRLADLPRASAAAASPAPADARSVFVASGDDGSQALGNPAEHRGFAREILRYDVATDAWSVAGAFDGPAPVTLPTAPWGDAFVLVSGEVRPGVRTPRVFVFRPGARR